MVAVQGPDCGPQYSTYIHTYILQLVAFLLAGQGHTVTSHYSSVGLPLTTSLQAEPQEEKVEKALERVKG
jgi:hypothetical protein